MDSLSVINRNGKADIDLVKSLADRGNIEAIETLKNMEIDLEKGKSGVNSYKDKRVNGKTEKMIFIAANDKHVGYMRRQMVNQTPANWPKTKDGMSIQPRGKNKTPKTGLPGNFYDSEKWKEHVDKHITGIDRKTNKPFMNIATGKPYIPSFPNMDKLQYANKAKAFVEQPVGGDILGYMRKDGTLVRFNKSTGEFGTMYPDLGVKTYFIAKNDEPLENRLKYYETDKMNSKKKDGIIYE